MPGTPPTTSRHAIPRYGDLDGADIGAIANSISDRVDVTAPVFGSGLLASRPNTGAGIADRYYYATDAVRPDGSTGVLYRDAGGATPTWTAVTPVAPRAISTSLPVSPVAGQEILFQDTAVLGPANIIWPLRYDGTKWVPLGCTPLRAEIDTQQGVGSSTYADAPTAGPTVTVPLAGDYIVRHGARIIVAGLTGMVSYAIGATPAADADAVTAGIGAGQTLDSSPARERTKTGLAAATAITVKYKGLGSASSITYANRWLSVQPIRLG